MSEPTLSDNMDSNALLTALISGGIISGSVGILEGTFEKTKYIFPTAIALGIWADYLIQRQRNRENIELVQDYVFEIEDLTKENEGYFSQLTTALISVTTACLGGIFVSVNLNNWSAGRLQSRIIPFGLESGTQTDFPQAQISTTGVSSILAPTLLQVLMSSNNRRHGGTAVISILVNQAFQRINFAQLLENSLTAGTNVAQIASDSVAALSNILNDMFSNRIENTSLTNENTLILESPDGERSFAALFNRGNGRTEFVPSVRLNRLAYEEMEQRFRQELNIVPNTRTRLFEPVPGEALPQAMKSDLASELQHPSAFLGDLTERSTSSSFSTVTPIGPSVGEIMKELDNPFD